MEIEYGNCDVCNIQSTLSRKHYYYDINCNCCITEDGGHLEIVRTCIMCEPEPPERVSVVVKSTNE